MRFGSVCSGIEAASVAWHPLGWETAWVSEIDKAAAAVLAYRFPNIPNLGDMTEIPTLIDAGIVEAPDILVGGTPCQGFSVAGKRGSLSDPRGQLTLSFVEIADAIDRARRGLGLPPCIIVWENVPGVLNLKDNAFGHFLAALAGEDLPLEPPGRKWTDAGLVVGPERAIAWRAADAQYFGLPQRRKRVFVVASARDGFDPGEVLFEHEGVRRDSPPSRQAREDATHAVAPCLTGSGSGRGIERTGDTRGQDPVVAVQSGDRLTNRVSSPVVDVCPTLRAGGNSTGGDRPPGTDADTADSLIVGRVFGGGNCSGPIAAAAALNASERYDFDSETFIVEPQCVTGSVTHTLTAEGFDASEGGTGRGQPIVPTMGAGGHSDSHANGGVMPAVAYSIMPMNSGKDYKARATDIAQPIMAGGPVGGNQGGDYIVQPSVAYAIQERAVSENLENGPQGKGWQEGIGYTLEARNKVQAVGIIPFDTTQLTSPLNYSNPKPGDPCHPLAAGMHPPSVCAAGGEMAVRRLMPVECERLQGFPDNWTRIPVRFYRTKNVTATRPEDMWEYGWGPNEQPGWWLMAADGPRYKQCGNSMAVKVMAWLGGRIKGWLDLEPFRELIG